MAARNNDMIELMLTQNIQAMTDEIRKQIESDAREWVSAMIEADEEMTDNFCFQMGATHQDPIAEKRGYELGIQAAIELIKDMPNRHGYIRMMTYGFIHDEIFKELEKLKK
jgi:hypothetical protein